MIINVIITLPHNFLHVTQSIIMTTNWWSVRKVYLLVAWQWVKMAGKATLSATGYLDVKTD